MIGRKDVKDPKRKLTKATWRQYKSALSFVLKKELEDTTDGVVAEELQVALDRLRYEPQTGFLNSSSRTSAAKLKRFPADDYSKLMDYLESRVGKDAMANMLRIWLRANDIVGLRPGEWAFADLIETRRGPALRVRNAKTTNGRGNGTYRTLMLDQASPEDLEAIREMLESLVGFEENGVPFPVLQAKLTYYMCRSTRRALGKRKRYPTLYSQRHQLSADAKADNLSHREVAALIGHGSDATASTHYGRRTSGRRPLKVSANAKDVARVKSSPKTAYHPKPK